MSVRYHWGVLGMSVGSPWVAREMSFKRTKQRPRKRETAPVVGERRHPCEALDAPRICSLLEHVSRNREVDKLTCGISYALEQNVRYILGACDGAFYDGGLPYVSEAPASPPVQCGIQ